MASQRILIVDQFLYCRIHETLREPSTDRDERHVVLELPAVEHTEQFLPGDSPRPTVTPPSAAASHEFHFSDDTRSQPDLAAIEADSEESLEHVVQAESISPEESVVPLTEEAAAEAAEAPEEETAAAQPEPAKRQLSQEEEDFIKAAQYEIDALVISLDSRTAGGEPWSESATENGSEMDESDADSVALDIRQLKEFDPRRESIQALTEVTVDTPTEGAESPVQVEEAVTAEMTPKTQASRPQSQSLLTPTAPTSSDRPRSPWHHRDRVPSESTELKVSPDTPQVVLTETTQTAVSAGDVSIVLELPMSSSPPLPPEPTEDDADDPELVTAFHEESAEGDASTELSLKPQWMVRPSSPWAPENLHKEPSKTESHVEELKPSGRDSPKLFDYSSSSDGRDDPALKETPAEAAAAEETPHQFAPIVTTQIEPTASAKAPQDRDEEDEEEEDAFIIVDPQELLKEADIFGDGGTHSDPHTQSESFSDYDLSFEAVDQPGAPEETEAVGTGSPGVQTPRHTDEDQEGEDFSLKPQWLVRPLSPWFPEKMAEMSHSGFPAQPELTTPTDEKSPSQTDSHRADASETSPDHPEMTSSTFVTVSTTDPPPPDAASGLSSPPQVMVSSDASLLTSSSDTIQLLGSSGTLPGSSENLGYDADEEISSGSEALHSPGRGALLCWDRDFD